MNYARCAAILCASLWVGSCSSEPDAMTSVPNPEGVTLQGADSSMDSPGGTEPVAQWKAERKRLAMLGLRYEGTQVQRVEEEAAAVLEGLSAADLSQLISRATEEYESNHQLDAIASWTRVVLLDPTEAEHYLHLGLALRGFKLETQAEAAFRHGLGLSPEHVELNLRVASMEWGAARLDEGAGFGEAVERYGKVLQIDDRNAEAWSRLARAHFYAERDDEAWRAIQRTQELGGRIPAQMIALLSARTPEPTR